MARGIKLLRGLKSTYDGTKWELGVTKKKPYVENPKLCSKNVFHCYDGPLQAAFMAPIQCKSFTKAYECEYESVGFDGTKHGTFDLKLIKEIKLPKLTTKQRVLIAIRTVQWILKQTDINIPEWDNWAEKYANCDASADAAIAAASAARSAVRAAASAARDAAIAAIDAADAAIDAAIDAAWCGVDGVVWSAPAFDAWCAATATRVEDANAIAAEWCAADAAIAAASAARSAAKKIGSAKFAAKFAQILNEVYNEGIKEG